MNASDRFEGPVGMTAMLFAYGTLIPRDEDESSPRGLGARRRQGAVIRPWAAPRAG